MSVTLENVGDDRGVSELLSRLLSASIRCFHPPGSAATPGTTGSLFLNSPDPSQTSHQRSTCDEVTDIHTSAKPLERIIDPRCVHLYVVDHGSAADSAERQSV